MRLAVSAASIIEVFSSQCDILLSELATAAERGDVDELRAKAHKLKGSARTIGAAKLGDLCQVLEGDARDGAVPDAVAKVRAIESATQEARAALAAL